MRDACRGIKGQPIDEVCVFPQSPILPKSMKVATKRCLRIWVFGRCNSLRNVASVARLPGAQCSDENLERLVLWKLRGSVESDRRPLVWSTVLHDESNHLGKIR